MNDEMDTDTREVTPSLDSAAPAESARPSAPPDQPPVKTEGRIFNPWPALALLVAVLALGATGWQWMETRQRLTETQQEMARRLSDADAVARESRTLANQARERLAALQGKLGELEGRLAESKSQQETLEALYQNLSRGNEESLITEIEQAVTLASQQLQLAGNIQGAVLALETADARLADNRQPQFINLRKVLTHDLERLRALPQLDLPGMYLRLENVIDALGTLPLAVSARSGGERREASPESSSSLLSLTYWRALAADFWRDVRGLVRIQRLDRAAPMLLAPEQDFFLRENIKLRLLDARLALFARDQSTYRNELGQSCAWIERYFDGNDKAVQNSLQTLRQLATVEISAELPNLNESLSAIKRFRAEKEQR
ncbi:MAG: uroporphyrinogen-III C-methyltransferase [Candidatus Accumulibacter sp.]|jgi:uroporphyrin-3 C-methyltransferase|nr:uroporphyrinogen-III C-methyltransferase [Accumulibacter sp.]